MTQEALKLAFEALRNYAWHNEACPQHPTYSEPENYPQCTCGFDKVITAIEEALAEPEQEPVVGTKTWFEDGKVVTQHLTAKDIYKEPEQEPVIDKSAAIRIATTLGWTSPRPWVGLTDEEIDNINYTSAYMLAREVEGKLKERNQ